MIRIGQGFDIHAFDPNGSHLVLGGVRIPWEAGFLAHSDGDVLLHAICDALLGAAALGDIGQHFPDTDPRWENADSRELTRQVVAKLDRRGFECVNVDATIIAEAPRLQVHIPAMVTHIADDLNIAGTAVNVKATTAEKLGFIGRGEGMAAMANVLLQSR